MNLKYLVVFFFPELLNEQSSKTQSQNFSGGNLLKDMWNPNKKNKTCPPIQVNLCYFNLLHGEIYSYPKLYIHCT